MYICSSISRQNGVVEETPTARTGAIGGRDANSEDWSHWWKRRQQRGLEPLVEETPTERTGDIGVRDANSEDWSHWWKTARTGAIGGRDANSEDWSHWWKRRQEWLGAPRPGPPHGGHSLPFRMYMYLNSASMMGHLVENWPRK